MSGSGRRSEESLPRRVEVLAGLSVAIDLGLGQPTEHMLRSATIGCRLADRLGLDPERRGTVFYTALVMWIGCHADSQEYARWFGDDIAVRREAYLIDWSGLPYLRFLVGNVAKGEALPRRLTVLGTLFRDARGQLSTLVHSHCASAAALARHIGLPAEVATTLAYAFERYDGQGLPAGSSGDQIPIEMRVAQFADVAEVHYRMYGLEAMITMAGTRRGGQFDPAVVDAALTAPETLFAPAADGDVWGKHSTRRLIARSCSPTRASTGWCVRSATSSTSSVRSRWATRGPWPRSRRRRASGWACSPMTSARSVVRDTCTISVASVSPIRCGPSRRS
jgi:hypothetical protein